MSFELKRRPKSLSYSALSQFEKDPEEFFIRYLAGTRAPKLPQENYMSVGSGFDAYAKSALHAALFGSGADPKFEFDAIFREQVEEHNRDFARDAGKYIFDCYVLTGAYGELLTLLKQGMEQTGEPPQFETKVEGNIAGVPFNGKPDLRFLLKPADLPVRVVLDWKVKGFCSKHGASPTKGYRLCRDGYESKKPSRSHQKAHNLYLPLNHRGYEINAGYMETCNDEYADQVSIYGWLLGEKPGDENVVVCIDEIVSKYMDGARPLLRVANHRARVKREYQLKLLERAKGCWDAITTGHVFQDMSREDSDGRCEVLEQMSVGLQTDGTSAEAFFNECVRPQFSFKR